MEKIVFNKRVANYLNDIVLILYNNNYFSYFENAIEYKDFILNEITISNLKFCKTSKPKHKQYGAHYISIKLNNRTMWYVFFDKVNTTYYIEYITNNHVSDAQFLNG
ncbi:MAG: hypothetical protein H7141_08600 [Burkholderiales bacterium]|nr:hypothetical protein [Bacteroidia bacterium]